MCESVIHNKFVKPQSLLLMLMSSKPHSTKDNRIFVVIFSHYLIDTLFVNCEWLVNGNNISFKSCPVLLNGIGMAQKSISLMSDLVSLLLSANRTA